MRTRSKRRESIRVSRPLFITQGDDEYKNRLVKTFCTKSGVCLDFGQHRDIVINYFSRFNLVNNRYISGIRKIGQPSANGVIIDVQFERENIRSHAVLKIAASKYADNLMYELFVGRNFINKYVNIFPCFTETYDFYKFIDTQKHAQFIAEATTPQQLSRNLLKSLIKKDTDINDICVENELFGISIQHFDNFMTLSNAHVSPTEVPGILYQGYFALHCLRKKFTHYDLHEGNFGFYKPFRDKYIVMHYIDGPNEVTFSTQYISKIIDYGRCFYDIDGVVTRQNSNVSDIFSRLRPRPRLNTVQLPRDTADTSTNIIDYICNIPTCIPDCGYRTGLGNITRQRGVSATVRVPPSKQPDIFYWINPTTKNESHDLRALHGISYFLETHFEDHIGTVVYESMFGTPENINIPYNPQTKDVRNVSDACIMLSGMIASIDYNKYEQHQHANNISKAGDLYIYSDGRPYEWNVA